MAKTIGQKSFTQTCANLLLIGLAVLRILTFAKFGSGLSVEILSDIK